MTAKSLPDCPIKLSKKWLGAIFAAELGILVAFFIAVEFFVFYHVPVKSGFWCNDLSLRESPALDTVSFPMLIVWVHLTPLTTIAIVEGIRMVSDGKSGVYTKFEYGHHGAVKYAIRFCYSYWCYLATFVPAYSLTNVAKAFTSRLRPSFIAVCQPNVNVDWCIDHPVYISNYTCTGPSTFGNNQQFYSFWSGHAAFSATTSTFIAVYLYVRLREVIGVKSLLLVLQTGVMAFAVMTGITRYTDRKHHASDVATGFVVGILIPFFILSKLGFMKVPKKDISLSDFDNNIEIIIARTVTQFSNQVNEKSPVPSYSSSSFHAR